MMGGTSTATVLAELGSERDVRIFGGVAIHETFHVFQKERYPEWSANEVDLMVYPIEDASLLALRRMETEALRRALTSDEGGSRPVCWANAASGWRAERYSRLAAPFVEYERGAELLEGMARYVQNKSLGSGHSDIPDNGFPAADVRARQYVIGEAVAVLLDRFAPDWTDSVHANGVVSLDSILTDALARFGNRTCELTDDEQSDLEKRAKGDVRAYVAFREAEETRFRNQVGWTLVIVAADSAPLWPQGFDPLNVLRTDSSDILHKRWLKAGNDAGTIERRRDDRDPRSGFSDGRGGNAPFVQRNRQGCRHWSQCGADSAGARWHGHDIGGWSKWNVPHGHNGTPRSNDHRSIAVLAELGHHGLNPRTP
jgi:hypothetical protein